MRDLAKILMHTSVLSLINAKPLRKQSFIYLHQEDTIRDALNTFIINDIESVPICNSKPKESESDFIGIISLVNLLKFIYSKDCTELNIQQLLDLKLTVVIASAELIQSIEFIQPDASLLHLLLNVWCDECKPKSPHIDCKHLLTTTEFGTYEVITPLDFLRHLLYLDNKAIDCLENTQATDIENGFEVDENVMICWDEDVKVAVHRIIRSDPNYIIAVVNEETGKLEANISFSDVIPSNQNLLEESVSLIRRDGISIKSFLMATRTNNYSIDPLLLHDNCSVFELIKKMAKLGVHHLWRVTADSAQKPLGAVGISDILRYLSFMFLPFNRQFDQDFKCENSINARPITRKINK